VVGGLNVPQGSPVATEQLQVTPALVVSFETVAARIAVAPVWIDFCDGNVVITTETVPAVPRATLALAVLVLSATEFAVMMMLLPADVLDGAV
jgi:hypothetical protein